MLNKPLRLWHLVAVLAAAGALVITGSSWAARSGSGAYYEHSTFTVAPHKGDGGIAKCMKGDLALGGGATYGGASPQVVDLRATYPWDSGDADVRTDYGWGADVKNEGDREVDVTVWAVCK